MRIGIGETPNGMPNTGPRVLVGLLRDDYWLSSTPDGHVGGRIATAWEWEDEGRALRLKLRPDVFFHDGTPLTPQVAAEAIRATDTSSDYFSLRSVASVEPEGSDSVVIRLSQPNGFLLTDLSGTPVLKPNSPDVGTGPFQVVKQTRRDAMLKSFPKYYRGQAQLTEVDVISYPTQRNAWTALMRSDIDMLYEVSRDSAEFVRAETTVRTYPNWRKYYIPLVFNVRHPILSDVRVRRAINEALDRDALVRDGLRGQGTPADGPVWPQHWAYSTPVQPFAFDPVAARKRLDDAGYPLKPNDERRVAVRFSFKCLVFGNDSRLERFALLAQKELADIGIDMQLESIPLNRLVPRVAAGDFEAFLFEMSGRNLSRVYDFWHSQGGMNNNSGYRAADGVLDRLRVAQSDDEIRAAVAEVLRVLHDDPPAAFLAWQRTSRAVSARFEVSSEPDRDILPSVWMWRPATAATVARAR
jgi:peptide/nickel transport system substrate-binding protein